MKLKEAKVAAILVVMFVLVGSVYAADLTVPHTFSPGTPAKSSEMNENFAAIYAGIVNIPLKLNNWTKQLCGNWQETIDGIRVYGSGYRNGNWIYPIDLYNLSGAEVYIKWRANGNGTYSGGVGPSVRFGINCSVAASYPVEFTTAWSYNGSKIILNDTWYYSRFAFNSDGNFTVATATGSYDNDNGIEFYKSTGILCISPVPSTIIGLPSVGFGDNYGATGAWIEVAEAKTTGIRLSHNVVHFYDFEDSVKPTEFAYTGNWSIASKGFQSGKSLYINGAVNDSVTLEVTGATGVSFKVNSINDTVHFMIDDKLEWISTCCAGCSYSCWKEINLPFLQDTGKHILKWTIGGSSEVWIDNIAIYTIQGACTSELAVKPYTFTPGAPAKAAEVNADFDALYKNDINLNCQIQALKTIVCQDHPTASVCQ